MPATVHGIHHVTAIAGDPRENLAFYTGVLGLRLVKKSVNQDVPDTYHLFYADAEGTPGTDLTFFPWPRLAPAKRGTGVAAEVAFAVPDGSLGYWRDRLEGEGAATGETETRFGERALPVRDSHGLSLALVETDDERPWSSWKGSPVPVEHQLRGMHSVRIRVGSLGPTRSVVEGALGFEEVGEEDGRVRFAVDGGGPGCLLEVSEDLDAPRGTWGVGGIHHVAWRVRDDEEEMAVRRRVREAGLDPTPQIDRFWFRSVYFNEPGGVLFELATEGPGFDRDEDPDRLGETLILPPWLESRREEIEEALPSLETLPDGG